MTMCVPKPFVRISLSQGRVALVDAEDYSRISFCKWAAHKNKGNKRFYAFGHKRINGQLISVQMHREIMGAQGDVMIDHKNGDGLDNRKSNLRICTRIENSQNVRVIRSAAGFKGVGKSSNHERPFLAKIQAFGQEIHLGNFESAIEAAAAYDRAAVKYHGEFAATNADLLNEDKPSSRSAANGDSQIRVKARARRKSAVRKMIASAEQTGKGRFGRILALPAGSQLTELINAEPAYRLDNSGEEYEGSQIPKMGVRA